METTVKEMLLITEEFATSEEECNRFIHKELISEKYKTVFEKYGQ